MALKSSVTSLFNEDIYWGVAAEIRNQMVKGTQLKKIGR